MKTARTFIVWKAVVLGLMCSAVVVLMKTGGMLIILYCKRGEEMERRVDFVLLA